MDTQIQPSALSATIGRPSGYSPLLAKQICEMIESGMSIREICRNEDMPAMSMIFRWLNSNQEFREQYTLARESQAETMADELVDIADNGTNDWMERLDAKTGECVGWRENGESVRRSQLRVETRKWVAAKLLPKKYGDIKATQVNVTLNMPSGFSEMLQVDAQEFIEGE